MSSGQSRSVLEGDLQIVAVEDKPTTMSALPPRPPPSTSNAIVEYTRAPFKEEEEDIEIKLRRILENVPVRVSNTSGSSAGSGSGDFHQTDSCYPGLNAKFVLKYRQMRRKEQDRLVRMEVDYQRRREVAEFEYRREQRLKAAEEQAAKKRAKRQKKKQRKKEKRSKPNTAGGEHQKVDVSDDSGDTDNDEKTGDD
ncbi:PRKR-interacting protein 1-like isoform X1 [Chenopodium quinoa]|uniref:PRKR-interacting protein 1-like isoform X1 n=1 Tax=Chenopodium quinoa TaxID=63459 RepID=UPI000B76D5B6|nr:PRKR-interacting protein 1-like isoform X1 [Chenopodium quinoa]